MKRAIGIVGGTTGTGRPTVQNRRRSAWCIDNKNPRRWLPGEAVLVQYEPQDQFATIIDPETLEML